MGKRYYCDYCDKTMVAAPSIVRTHNNGLVHQKLVNQHYQQFKDPVTILNEEMNKKPCLRFAKGECVFDGICRFSHYSKEQIDVLKEYVAAKERAKMEPKQPSFQDLYLQLQNEKSTKLETTDRITMLDSSGITHVFPWSYNPVFDGFGDNLPPSLKRFKIDDFRNITLTEWG